MEKLFLVANKPQGKLLLLKYLLHLTYVVALYLSFMLSTGNANSLQSNHALLQGLDKVTARVSKIPITIGGGANFGTLEIKLLACHYTPPEEPPESTAYINISEIRPGENNKKAFDGWMFASSPGLNPLEHPVYDIWVLKCGHNEGDGENVGGTPQDGE